MQLCTANFPTYPPGRQLTVVRFVRGRNFEKILLCARILKKPYVQNIKKVKMILFQKKKSLIAFVVCIISFVLFKILLFSEQQQNINIHRFGSGEFFNTIAELYDVTNKVMTFGLDANWRQQFISLTALKPDSKVLDLATGTGNFHSHHVSHHY